jgi:hypothetical protein
VSNNVDNKRQIRTTAMILAAIALFFYLGFILLGVLRA